MYKIYSFVIISCISSFFVFNITRNKETKLEEKEEIIEKEKEEIVVEKVSNNNTIEESINDKEEQELMTLEIPKIGFKGKIYNKNSELNNIDKNIIIMNESDLPSKEGGIVIIGGHSGYGKYAYFKHLNKLEENDEVIIHYLNNTYTYKVVSSHLDSKDGTISISNYNKKNKLFLYTCNPNDKNNYLVFICERD